MTYHQAHWLIDLHKTSIGKKFNGRYIKKLLIAPVYRGKILMLASLALNPFILGQNLAIYEEFDVIVIYDQLEGISNDNFLINASASFFHFFGISK